MQYDPAASACPPLLAASLLKDTQGACASACRHGTAVPLADNAYETM